MEQLCLTRPAAEGTHTEGQASPSSPPLSWRPEHGWAEGRAAHPGRPPPAQSHEQAGQSGLSRGHTAEARGGAARLWNPLSEGAPGVPSPQGRRQDSIS